MPKAKCQPCLYEKDNIEKVNRQTILQLVQGHTEASQDNKSVLSPLTDS